MVMRAAPIRVGMTRMTAGPMNLLNETCTATATQMPSPSVSEVCLYGTARWDYDVA